MTRNASPASRRLDGHVLNRDKSCILVYFCALQGVRINLLLAKNKTHIKLGTFQTGFDTTMVPVVQSKGEVEYESQA